MKRFLGIVLALFTLFSISSCAPRDPASRVGKEVEKLAASYGFEGVIAVWRDGKPLVSFAKGRLPDGSAVTFDSAMPVGSVSKQFCAAAVLLLQDQGKLKITDTLDKFYPSYAEGSKISLKHLLSMRSGLTDLVSEAGLASLSPDRTEAENVAAMKEWLFSQPLAYKPGAFYMYCNSNFFLLADIVEQVSGEKYIDFLQKNVFSPLGMSHTDTFGGNLRYFGDMPGDPTGAFAFLDEQPGIVKGAGDLVSDAEDIRLWLEALTGGKLLSEESYRAMTTDYSPEGNSYGFGVRMDFGSETGHFGGVGHYGTIGIYSAFDYRYAEKDLTIFIVSNSIDPGSIEDFSRAVMALLPD
ncbi:MAG: beta-lactamase family protein [Clostridia bacterium]|nr:beta-lactamase family protein [Clostridia bacterium]